MTVAVEQWGIHELALQGPEEGNPFVDVTLEAAFSLRNRHVRVRGFYDSEGVYRVRFSPDTPGDWRYSTVSNVEGLDGINGEFTCFAATTPGNHGPVRVRDTYHFQYEDGTSYLPIGTTCYAWTHQSNELQEQTLETLRHAPFNKLRMCVFPKHYDFNHNEPLYHPFAGSLAEGWDFRRFNLDFFRHFEGRVADLQALGIEADIILFHPYDRWGYASMGAENDAFYLRYLIARLAAYRNVWWSLANEFDLMPAKTLPDWDRLFQIVQEEDPSQHLRSIHNCIRFYDHTQPWVTHASIQGPDLYRVYEWQQQYRKPIVVDECCYEGNINHGWGNISGEELTRRHWEGMARAGYVGHSETFMHPEEILWWSHGGVLHGESPARIAFLRTLLQEVPAPGLRPQESDWDAACAGIEGEYYLSYFGFSRPSFRHLKLPEDVSFTLDIIDTWEMTITTLPESYSGHCIVQLPGKSHIAIRARKMQA